MARSKYLVIAIVFTALFAASTASAQQKQKVVCPEKNTCYLVPEGATVQVVVVPPPTAPTGTPAPQVFVPPGANPPVAQQAYPPGTISPGWPQTSPPVAQPAPQPAPPPVVQRPAPPPSNHYQQAVGSANRYYAEFCRVHHCAPDVGMPGSQAYHDFSANYMNNYMNRPNSIGGQVDQLGRRVNER